ncbi:MAG TPA: transporter substrate-binding domain-containing protein [Gaiellaceae bacterium]|jgi:polar amino acid transport system substrate-binding protein
MKRIILATAGVAVFAVFAATLGSAQPTASTGPAQAEASSATLPKLPADIAKRKRFIVGVKCDTPPFGYTDVRGKNAGVDVEIAKWFARYAFGREQRLTFVCAPTAVREPLLTGGRVDLVISTFTYTADRDTRIDFSRAYYKATGRLLVKNNSPIQSLNDIRGRTVATTPGSIYDRWMRRCYSNTQILVVESVTAAILAFNQGRADAVMFDDTSLALQAATDPNAKLTDDLFLEAPYGIGIRQGNVALKRWVDSRLAIMKQKDIFQTIIRNNVAPRFVPAFSRNILRPNNTFTYRAANLPSVDTVCP